MHTLVVELKIPIDAEPLIGAAALTFTRWFPIGKAAGIPVREDNIELVLWFDLQATWWASRSTEEELKHHNNVLAHYVHAEVIVHGVDADLAGYMQNRVFDRQPNDSERTVQAGYEKVGTQLLEVVLNRVNRLISYARVKKGQYWLLEHKSGRSLHDYFQLFEAAGRIDGGKSFRFLPDLTSIMPLVIGSRERYIAESEWADAAEFVRGKQRPPLVLELLAGSERLAANGYSRSALTEAVTALEVALSSFGRNQDRAGKLASIVESRTGISKLQQQIEHMGLSGTVNVLLPLLLPPSVLPSEVLSICQDAVQARQNVVHNGAREVPDVHKFIKAIRTCCRTLLDYTVTNESS